jgi:hypothetical protein
MSETCKRLAVATAFLSVVACSSGREPLNEPIKLSVPGPTPQDLSASVSTAPQSWATVDWSNPISVMTVPYAGCTIRPQGTTDSRNAFVSATSDAVIRFYPPPATWGTLLTLDCTANGTTSSSATYSVDLNDSSTFFKEPALLGGPRIVGTRPALSGDLSAVSQQLLLQSGYPLRPNATGNPQGYGEWVKNVTSPVQIIDLTGVFVIGRRGASTYDYGRFQYPFTAQFSWMGQVLDPQGFSSNPPPTPPYPNSGEVELLSYETYIEMPTLGSCAYYSCQATLWGGLGGYTAEAGGLIQSGYVVFQGTGAQSVLFAEFVAPGNAAESSLTISLNQLPGSLPPGQNLLAEGWASTSTGGPQPPSTSTVSYATFMFCGPNWCSARGAQGGTENPNGVTLQAPPNAQFSGATSEAIVELSTYESSMDVLANFGTIQFINEAWDADYNVYYDMNSQWIFLNMINPSDNQLMAYPYFSGDPNLPYTSSNPYPYDTDPWDQSHILQPFQVKWYAAQ